MEIWKDIEGYEGLYQVSTYGRVKCLPKDVVSTKHGHIRHYPERIAKTFNRNGYLSVELSKNGKRKKFTVHRLVAVAFINNPVNKPQVNHIDGNKLNNSVSNLEWATPKENIDHAYENGLKVAPEGNDHWSRTKRDRVSRKLTENDVREIKNRLKNGERQKDIAKDFNVFKSTISKINIGETWDWVK